MESYQATDVANYSICGKGSERLLQEIYGEAALKINPRDLAAVHQLARMTKDGEAGETAPLLMPLGGKRHQEFRKETLSAPAENVEAKKMVDHDVTSVAMGGKAIIQMDNPQAAKAQTRQVTGKKPKGRSR